MIKRLSKALNKKDFEKLKEIYGEIEELYAAAKNVGEIEIPLKSDTNVGGHGRRVIKSWSECFKAAIAASDADRWKRAISSAAYPLDFDGLVDKIEKNSTPIYVKRMYVRGLVVDVSVSLSCVKIRLDLSAEKRVELTEKLRSMSLSDAIIEKILEIEKACLLFDNYGAVMSKIEEFLKNLGDLNKRLEAEIKNSKERAAKYLAAQNI